MNLFASGFMLSTAFQMFAFGNEVAAMFAALASFLVYKLRV